MHLPSVRLNNMQESYQQGSYLTTQSFSSNRLHRNLDGSFYVTEKPLGYVIGEQVVAPVMNRVSRLVKRSLDFMRARYNNPTSQLLCEVKASPSEVREKVSQKCVDKVLGRYGDIESSIKQVVRDVCLGQDEILVYKKIGDYTMRDFFPISDAGEFNTVSRLKAFILQWKVPKRRGKYLEFTLLTRGLGEIRSFQMLGFVESVPFESSRNPNVRKLERKTPLIKDPSQDDIESIKDLVSYPCLTHISVFAEFRFDKMAAIVNATASAEYLAHVYVYGVPYNYADEAILSAIRANKCILRFYLMNSDALRTEIRELTKGRVPCETKSICKESPTLPTSPSLNTTSPSLNTTSPSLNTTSPSLNTTSPSPNKVPSLSPTKWPIMVFLQGCIAFFRQAFLKN